MSAEVKCIRPGCHKTWSSDPVLDVECPIEKCSGKIGKKCTQLRPSEHRLSAGFAGLMDHGHDERDLLANAMGFYGECPLGLCGNPKDPRAEEARQAAALIKARDRGLPLFEGAA